MKKIALILGLFAGMCVSGCTEFDHAVEDYCSWESYCGFRSYSECSDRYYDYSRDFDCNYEIIEMTYAYQSLTCRAYRDYASSINPCDRWNQNGYHSYDECQIAMERVYRADDELRYCLGNGAYYNEPIWF